MVGVVWEITAVNTFAKRAGRMEGMISNPRPLDYIQYDYTPEGRRIAFWSFTLPLTATGILLLVIGTAGTITLIRSGLTKQAFVLWCGIVGCAAVFAATTTYYYLITTNFFI
jgi:hypothetical protein